MMILLVCELTRNLPTLTEIELRGNRIRPNDAKAARQVATGGDLSFTLREQFASNTLSTVFAKYPQVANPLLTRYDHAHNLFIRNCHPGQRPILLFELQGNRIRSKKIAKCFIRHRLYQSPYRVVFAGLWSPHNAHPAILVERRWIALEWTLINDLAVQEMQDATLLRNNFLMCGRYRLKRRKQVVEEYFDTARVEHDWNPRYHIAPTRSVPIIRQNRKEPVREMSFVLWGLIPSWAEDSSVVGKMINARFETASMKPAFRDALKCRRCLIPADVFYEWKRMGKSKQPFLFRSQRRRAVRFRRDWDRW
jgi:hypothetical protein